MSVQYIYNAVCQDNSSFIRTAVTSIITGRLTGGFVALSTVGLAESIKLWVNQRDARERLLKAVCREFAANYLAVEDILASRSDSAVQHILKRRLRIDCYAEAKKQLVVFWSEEGAHWFDGVYLDFPEWKELTNADSIRDYFEPWYNGVRRDLRHVKALTAGLRRYLSKEEFKSLKLDSPPVNSLT